MKKQSMWLILILFFVQVSVIAQNEPTKEAKPIPDEEQQVTSHSIKINGKDVKYEATAATMNIKNRENEPIAQFGYVAYTRTIYLTRKNDPLPLYLTVARDLLLSGYIWELLVLGE